MLMALTPSQLSSSSGPLWADPSPLRPPCRADKHIFKWVGVNRPPPSVIDDPLIRYIATVASRTSLRDTGSYGSGLKKFHTFCNVFSIPEPHRLPASFPILHSFALWAASDPAALGVAEGSLHALFEPVAVGTVQKYLAAVRAWHIAQGWPPPLSKDEHNHINFSLRGLENVQGARKKQIRLPVTLQMLRALKHTLDLNKPFDTCVWAMACCAFWGMMHFGKVSAVLRAVWDGSKHLKCSDVLFGEDQDGKPYACLGLPSAKTAKAGEIQYVFLVGENDVCPPTFPAQPGQGSSRPS